MPAPTWWWMSMFWAAMSSLEYRGREHLGARDGLERRAELAQAPLDVVLVAVEPHARAPPAEAELAPDALVDLVGQRVRAVVPLRPRPDLRGDADALADRRDALEDPGHHELADDVDRRADVVLAPHADHDRGVGLGAAHEPDAHPRDDAVVGLDEEGVEARSEAALVQMPRPVARKGAHPGAQHLAVGQHDLHAARRAEVLAVGQVGDAVVERVADDAAPADVRDRQHEVMAARDDRVVEVEPAHARLDDGVGELLVDLQDPVHVAQAHDGASRRPAERGRRSRCCAPGCASRAGPGARWRSARPPAPARWSGITTADGA